MNRPPPVFLSVVAPCYNEELGLEEFHARVAAVCSSLFANQGLRWEIVLVNDGSRDGTFAVMKKLARADPNLVAVNLARNYGHQLALTAGLQHCRGERILIIDADLQDPPELLVELLRVMDRNEADVVYGQRRKRVGETRFKLLMASLFYRLLRRLVEVDIPLDTGDFRLMNRRTLDVLNAMPEQHRFVRGLIASIGLRQIPLLYDRAARTAGETSYPLSKMMRFALDAITSFSIIPLRFASVFGAVVGLLGILGLFYTVGSWAFGSVVQGWTSMATLMLIIGGVQLIVLGVFGEYLGRLYIEAKRRPLFVVDQVITGTAYANADPASKLPRHPIVPD